MIDMIQTCLLILVVTYLGLIILASVWGRSIGLLSNVVAACCIQACTSDCMTLMAVCKRVGQRVAMWGSWVLCPTGTGAGLSLQLCQRGCLIFSWPPSMFEYQCPGYTLAWWDLWSMCGNFCACLLVNLGPSPLWIKSWACWTSLPPSSCCGSGQWVPSTRDLLQIVAFKEV